MSNNRKDLIKKIKSKSKYKSSIKTLKDSKKDLTPEDHFKTPHILFNLLISGDYSKGLFSNSSIQLLGDSDTGKSFLAKILLYSAYKKGYLPSLTESEGALMYKTLVSIGFDPEEMMMLRPKHVKELSSMLNELIEVSDREDKIFHVVDSIGNMPCSEEYEKRKNVNASDIVGKKAKEVNSMFRTIRVPAKIKNQGFIFVNREYKNMKSGMFVSEDDKEDTSGGSGNNFQPDVTVKFKKKNIKKQISYRDEDGAKKSRYEIVGYDIKFIIKKSRYVFTGSYGTMKIRDGKILKYSGLWEELTQSPFFRFDSEVKKGLRDILDKDGKIYKTIKKESDMEDEDWDIVLKNGFGDWLNDKYRLPDDDFSNLFSDSDLK